MSIKNYKHLFDLGELNKVDDRIIVAKGGLGGQAANQFNGLKGEELKIVLDLKLIADIGLVGFPNAGNSLYILPDWIFKFIHCIYEY